jgi:hypothetical protein
MTARRPQVNFQVEASMKTLYEQAKACGHWVTRLCAAGFLLMVEDPQTRLRALNRLREWEAQYADADPAEIHAFVENAQAAMTAAAPRTRRARKAPPGRKRAKRSGSA